MALTTEFLNTHFRVKLASLPEIAPPLPRRRLEWRHAWRSLRELITDPKQTEKVFELLGAIGGDDGESSFQRFLSHPDGRSLLASHPRLLEALADRGALSRMPEGSFGRAYLDFVRERGFEPGGLLEARANAKTRRSELDPIREWFFDRTNLMHDLWHVITGYGTDEAGESALLAFTLAQIPTRGMAVLVVAAAAIGPKDLHLSWPRYLRRAWIRGRRAVLLTTAPWEDLLPRPLEEVRLRLRIEPALVAHPGGIVTGDRTGAAAVAAAA
jgi:ubiquinone biosynthesis protein COQ4